MEEGNLRPRWSRKTSKRKTRKDKCIDARSSEEQSLLDLESNVVRHLLSVAGAARRDRQGGWKPASTRHSHRDRSNRASGREAGLGTGVPRRLLRLSTRSTRSGLSLASLRSLPNASATSVCFTALLRSPPSQWDLRAPRSDFRAIRRVEGPSSRTPVPAINVLADVNKYARQFGSLYR